MSALAGFLEPGETIEEGCAREIAEEAGLTVTAVRYHSSQPWPFPSQLMIGLVCEVDSGEATPDQTELEAVAAPLPRRAQFRCTLVLAWPDGHDEVFEGVMPGQVVWPMRGDQGHGYDPIFQPAGHDVTFGEMDRWAKNQISHRADAFRKLVAGCFT